MKKFSDVNKNLNPSNIDIEKHLHHLTFLLNQLNLHYEIVKQFNHLTEVEEFVVKGLRSTSKLLGIDGIYLFIKEGDTFEVISSNGSNKKIHFNKIDYNVNMPFFKVIKTKNPIVFEADRIKNHYGGEIPHRPTRKILSLPLIGPKKKIMGLLNFHSKDLNAFSETSIPFFQELSKEVAKTFNRARKFSFLKELSVIDELTGLYNRRFFYEVLEKEFKRAKRYSSSFTLVVADLDNFKQINDKYGHIKGDEVLKEVAKTIKNRLRVSDYPIRYGGDEFALILLQSGTSETEKIMNDINNKLMTLNFNIKEKVSLSFGMCKFSETFSSVNEMIEGADKELYKNKKKQT